MLNLSFLSCLEYAVELLFVDKIELLEIMKASTPKSLGRAHLDLPASLSTVPIAKERNHGTQLYQMLQCLR